MIVRERPSAWKLFFVRRGSMMPRIWSQLVGVGVVSLLIVAAHRLAPGLVPGMNPAPFALIGIALSIFLSFRNSSCYDRWWEGRKLWGEITQGARDLARQSVMLPPAPRKRLLDGAILFARATEHHLRGTRPTKTPDAAPAETPDAILARLAALVAEALRGKEIEPIEALALNDSLTRLSHALTGCERLSNTPLPFAYTLLLHRTAYLFCFLLPFGFADSLGWAAPLATMLVAYTFLGLDALSEELEEPFGLAPNDLPLTSYATMIEIHLRQALGEDDVPPAPVAQDYLLH
ncbi:bestrophin family protein [Paracoccus aminophilus]|nr:bestrophin family protein [Paracoccus aminophilus]